MASATPKRDSATGSARSPATSTDPLLPPGFGNRFTRLVTFHRMEVVSLCHSVIYAGLLLCAFLLGGPQPWTFILGLSHGLVWIGMSIAGIVAVRFRVINLRLALAVALLGCIAPFFGSIEFLRQSRQRAAAQRAATTP